MNDAVNYHNKLARSWDDRYTRRSFKRREDVVASLLKDVTIESRNWLDAGCGSGRLSRLLAAGGANVLGVDAASEMIESAVHLASPPRANEQLRFQQIKDVATLPFPSATFDGVLCVSVLEYLPDPIDCLSEFARVLRHGGTLIVSIPNTGSLLRRGQSALFAITSRVRQPAFPAYLRYSRAVASPTEFEMALRSAAFEPDRREFLGGPWPASLQSWFWLGSLVMFRARRTDCS
jgi:2-polyprenyl-3-methyl-5-hydroxy-6-metoxy-1,4-benzoquinol methylase